MANMNTNDGMSRSTLFFVEKKSCAMDDGNAELDPMIIIITDNEYNEIRTSCSQPLYLGQQFGSFTVVGYCVTGPAHSLQEEVCSGIYGGDNRENIVCEDRSISTLVSVFDDIFFALIAIFCFPTFYSNILCCCFYIICSHDTGTGRICCPCQQCRAHPTNPPLHPCRAHQSNPPLHPRPNA